MRVEINKGLIKARHECHTHGAVYSIDVSSCRVVADVRLPATVKIRDIRRMRQRIHDALEHALMVEWPAWHA